MYADNITFTGNKFLEHIIQSLIITNHIGKTSTKMPKVKKLEINENYS